MSHLSPAEFIDAAEGTLPPARLAHLDRCDRCASAAAALRPVIAAAADPVVPEPSPLYWERMRAQVRERIAGETVVPAWRARWREGFALRTLAPAASAVAVVAAIVVAGLTMRQPGVTPPASAPAVAVAVAAEPGIEPDGSEAWDMLTSAAADTPIEEAHAAGMAVAAGTIDRAVQRLSPEELSELQRLLQSELRRSGD